MHLAIVLLVIITVLLVLAGCSKTTKTTKTAHKRVNTNEEVSKMNPQESTLLKQAFERARQEKYMGIALSQFWKTDIYMIVGDVSEKGYDLVYTSSPEKGRVCVTVSENLEWLGAENWNKVVLSGGALIEMLEGEIEIVIVYGDGGDYITKEHLAWLREAIAESK